MEPPTFDEIGLVIDGRIARVTLDRPAAGNPLSLPMRAELIRALRLAESDESVSVVVIDGAGESFCNGYDLKRPFGSRADRAERPGWVLDPNLEGWTDQFERSCLADWMTLWDLLKPVVVVAHGNCLGGGVELLVDVAVGDVGEIVLQVVGGERRYWGDPEESSRTWRDGWLHTGDLGRFDADGFLYVVDRAKDVIIRGGYNVASAEVEAAVHEHPAVAECAVVGVPHPTLGHDVVAVVRMTPASAPLGPDELRRHLADRLADYEQPRRLVVVVDPLPRNSAGKVDKATVAERVASVPE